MKYLIGIDVGTSGTKTAIFDQEGYTIAKHTQEYPLHQPRNGWAEQNPEDWWSATVSGLKYCAEKVNPQDIAGIGLSGQMHGLVMLDETGNVLRPSIIWCDQRSSKECDEIENRVGRKRLIEITANPALTGFTASKILWVKNNQPELFKRCAHILLPKDYIRYRLTGDFATDVADASGMQLMDIPKRKYSNEILNLLEIPESLLGKLYESCEVTGVVSSYAAGITGLAEGTIVVAGAGDNFAAAVGTGVVSKGKGFTTLGTSGVVFVHSDDVKIEKEGRIHTFCSAVPGKWCVMSCTLAAGLSLKYIRDNFCSEEVAEGEAKQVDPYVLMDREAEIVPIGADRLFYLPYLMGERSPHLDPYARACLIGMSGVHTRGHIIRAVMEGVVFSQLDCLNIFRNMGINANDMLVCGGGAKSKLWRQMIADAYDCNVVTLVEDEGPALGAAILAGVGAGIYSSVEEGCDKVVKRNETQHPSPENVQEYGKYYEIYKELYPTLRSTFLKISNIR